MNNVNNLISKSGIFRLLLILFAFPLIIVYVLPLFGSVKTFYEGDRSNWFIFWFISFCIEWLTLGLVLFSFVKVKTALEEIGFPTVLKIVERNTILITLLIFILIAILGASRPQDFLNQIPTKTQIFIPPADLFSRLFWIAMSITAAVCEEILWRGIAITELKKVVGSAFLAVPISCFSFAFFHGGFDQGIVAFTYRFMIGIVLSLIYLKSGKLTWVCYIHFLMDAISLTAVQFD